MGAKKPFSSYPKHELNPFFDSLSNSFIKHRKQYKSLIRRDGEKLLDEETGNLEDVYSPGHFKLVDMTVFTKFVTGHSSEHLKGLTTVGWRVYNYIMKNLHKNSAIVFISVEAIKNEWGYENHRQVYTGISECIDAGIIEKTKDQNSYHVNYFLIFNGNVMDYIATEQKRRLK